MRRIVVAYDGPALAGKTSSMMHVEKTVGSRRVERHGPVLEVDLVVDDQLVLLRGAVGPLWLEDVWEELRASADAVVFVGDSQRERMEANEERAEKLDATLARTGTKPVCIQWNKRDLANAVAIEELSRRINRWRAPEFPSVASKGIGVLEALRAALALVPQR